VDYLGFVYEDPAVSQAVIRQKPFIVANPNSKSSQCIKHIVGRLEKTDTSNVQGLSGFLRKFIEKT
jgi:flagellar biosynthesis protein FlhG